MGSRGELSGIYSEIGKCRQRQRGSSRRKLLAARNLRFESLELRRMLAVFTVSNLDDGPVAAAGDQPGTLRQALFDANATTEADDIVFQNGLSGTILLTAGELSITESVSIVGPGADQLMIDASGSDPTPAANDGNGVRVLNIDNNNFAVRLSVDISD